MIEYPKILPSSQAPRQPCIAFEKFDGSNIRVKYTNKKGFTLFGSRTQLFNEGHPFLGQAVPIFYRDYEDKLVNLIESEFPNEREVIVFLEFIGPNSFAGYHETSDPKELMLFDIMVGHKNRKFLLPQEFVKLSTKFDLKIPKVVYEGNLSDQFRQDVRDGKYDVFEGVVCKGRERTGAHRGGVWMAKIKTLKYLTALNAKFGEKEAEKYGE
jgi:ATP-dependent RNA circularization protein (DNA/RNA ligase family)